MGSSYILRQSCNCNSSLVCNYGRMKPMLAGDSSQTLSPRLKLVPSFPGIEPSSRISALRTTSLGNRKSYRIRASSSEPFKKKRPKKSSVESWDVDVDGILEAGKGLAYQGSLVELFGQGNPDIELPGSTSSSNVVSLEQSETGLGSGIFAPVSGTNVQSRDGEERAMLHNREGKEKSNDVSRRHVRGKTGDLLAELDLEGETQEHGGVEEEELEEWESLWEDGAESEWEVVDGAKSARDWHDEEDMSRRWKLRNGREVFEERTFLMGVDLKSAPKGSFSIEESLGELSQLAETAGLMVVGLSHQRLEHPNPKTYIGAGKVAELRAAIEGLGVETVIFDDELSPAQLRNLEKALGENVRVCDRTALILDIFIQRAATKEATLQVELAQTEYQLPRLTRMWTHLERQAGGLVKGMGEKQIEVDKRILRNRISLLKKTLETVREHRHQYRQRRASTPIPVLSLVGYTNAGKSTMLNRLTGAGVLAEDKLFATLDPTTRRVELPHGKECLFTDTVGFIQKLPTQLVAAFRATLEEISDASLLLHVVDISHPMVEQQTRAVEKVLDELDVAHIPVLTVWNKMDRAANPKALRKLAARRGDIVCISALSGEGMDEFYMAIEDMIKDLMVPLEAVIPYEQGELLNVIHRLGMVDKEDYLPEGTLVSAHVPLSLSRQLLPLSVAQKSENGVIGNVERLHILPDFDISKIPGEERIIEIES